MVNGCEAGAAEPRDERHRDSEAQWTRSIQHSKGAASGNRIVSWAIYPQRPFRCPLEFLPLIHPDLDSVLHAAFASLPRCSEAWLYVGLHADLDLGILRQALAAMGDDQVDVQRGVVEEAGDVLGDGFILVRQRS